MQPKAPELFEVDTTDAMFSSSQLLQEQDRVQGAGACSTSEGKWNACLPVATCTHGADAI